MGPTRNKLTWVPVLLCCIAAIVAPFGPKWQAGFILPALALMYINYVLIQRDWRDMNEAIDLQDKWRRQRQRCA